MVLRDDHRDRLLRLQLLLHGEDDGLAEILARRIHHRDLAARADAWINRENRLFAERRREKKMPQILREYLDRRAVGLHLLLDRHVDLAARRQESLVRVLRSQLNLRKASLISVPLCLCVEDNLHHPLDDRLLFELQMHPQHLLGLSAADRQVAVARNRRDGLLEFVVLLELGRLRRLRRDNLALHLRARRKRLAHCAAHVGDVCDALRKYVPRPSQ